MSVKLFIILFVGQAVMSATGRRTSASNLRSSTNQVWGGVQCVYFFAYNAIAWSTTMREMSGPFFQSGTFLLNGHQKVCILSEGHNSVFFSSSLQQTSFAFTPFLFSPHLVCFVFMFFLHKKGLMVQKQGSQGQEHGN